MGGWRWGFGWERVKDGGWTGTGEQGGWDRVRVRCLVGKERRSRTVGI